MAYGTKKYIFIDHIIEICDEPSGPAGFEKKNFEKYPIKERPGRVGLNRAGPGRAEKSSINQSEFFGETSSNHIRIITDTMAWKTA